MKVALFPLAAVTTLLVSACAQYHGVKVGQLASTEELEVVATPAGAIAYNDLGNACVTPCTLPISRTDGGSILIAHEGYRTERHFIGTDTVPIRVGIHPTLT